MKPRERVNGACKYVRFNSRLIAKRLTLGNWALFTCHFLCIYVLFAFVLKLPPCVLVPNFHTLQVFKLTLVTHAITLLVDNHRILFSTRKKRHF